MCCQVAKVDGEDTDDAKARKKLQKHLKRQKNNSAGSSLQAWGACIQRLPVDTEGSRKRSRQEKHFFAEASKTATQKISKMEGGWGEKGAAPKKKSTKNRVEAWMMKAAFIFFISCCLCFFRFFLPSFLPSLFILFIVFILLFPVFSLACLLLPSSFLLLLLLRLLLHYETTTTLWCNYYATTMLLLLLCWHLCYPSSFLLSFPSFLSFDSFSSFPSFLFFSFPSFHFFPSLLPSVLSSFLAPFLPSLPIFLPAFLPYSFFILFRCKRCGWSSKMAFDTYPRNGSVQNFVSKFLNWINFSDDIIYKN